MAKPAKNLPIQTPQMVEGSIDLAHWRKKKKEGVDVMLPTGLAATIRPINILTILTDGLLPEHLRPELTKFLNDMTANRTIEFDDMDGRIDMFREIFAIAVQYPEVVGDDIEIAEDDMGRMNRSEIDIEDALGVTTFINQFGQLRTAEDVKAEQGAVA